MVVTQRFRPYRSYFEEYIGDMRVAVPFVVSWEKTTEWGVGSSKKRVVSSFCVINQP